MSFLYLFDLMGTFAFAISGAMMGANKKMDIYGLFILALATGVGGGAVRDICLGRVPPFFLKDIWYLNVIVLAVVLVFFLSSKVSKRLHLLNIADAVGLGVFTCIGASIAMTENVSWYGVVIFGVMTATVGGMIRDVFSQEVPFVLQKEVYASASIAGGFLFLLLDFLNINLDINIIFTSVMVTGIRIVAIYRGWNLPTIISRG